MIQIKYTIFVALTVINSIVLADTESAGDSWEAGVAYINGDTFRDQQVTYEIVGEFAIFEGDIILGLVDDMQTTIPVNLSQGVAVNSKSRLWPNGIVPFQFDANLTQTSKNNFTAATLHWQQKTSIRFVLRTTANQESFPDYINVMDSAGCSAHVGMIGGQQIINLGAACSVGNAIHEIGHALGLWHEQSRADRNSFVQILFANIIPGRESNFDQRITDGDDIGPYDYGSIMHYGTHFFSRNGLPTIVTTNPEGTPIGQRIALSPKDINTIASLYSQKNSFATWATSPGVQVISGDFDGDGLADIALTGVAGWLSLPVAFSNGDGSFRVTNFGIQDFSIWASTPGIHILSGDFDGDGLADIALTGGNWPSLPVAFSNGDGTFRITNSGIQNFSIWASLPGVQSSVGDYNGDNKDDIAISGGSGWVTQPIAFSIGNGTFNVTNMLINK